MTNKTPSGTKKRHRESIEQEKVTKWPNVVLSCSSVNGLVPNRDSYTTVFA